MRLVVDDLLVAMHAGIQLERGTTLRLAVTGIKGDMPFLIECGHLVNHFRRAPKRGEAAREPAAVCHLCLAGLRGYPFTDVSDRPAWEATMHSAGVAEHTFS